jgi:hypothetical protein
MHILRQNQPGKSLGWKIKSLLGVVICFALLMFSLAVPAMAEQATSLQAKPGLSQTNKAIALRYAIDSRSGNPLEINLIKY